MLREQVQARRARFALATSLLGGLVGLAMLFALFIQGQPFSLPFIVLLICTILACSSLFLFKRVKALAPVATVIVLTFLATLLVVGYGFGGVFSATIHWLPVVPLTATFMLGRRMGIFTAFLASIGICIIYYLEARGVAVQGRMNRDELLQIAPYVTVAAIFFVAMLAGAYEWAYHESLQKVEQVKAQRTKAQQALEAAKEQSLWTLESIADGVITLNANDEITYINPQAEVMTGWRDGEALNHSISEVFIIFDEFSHYPLGNFMADCRAGKYEKPRKNHVLLSLDGREIHIEFHVSLIFKNKDEISGMVIVFQDVSLERELTEQLRYQATHDPLSGVFNRHEFEHQLGMRLQTGEIENDVLCTVDISQFRMINESCGNAGGDELIRQFAEILLEESYGDDVIGRLGGNEFGWLMTSTDQKQANQRSDFLHKKLDEYRFYWGDKSFSVAVAIGLVSLNEGVTSVPDIMNDADAARQAAKERGRNCIHWFQPNDNELLKRRGETRWASYLNDAISKSQFVLARQVIQPVFEHEDGAHFEVLLRYQGDDGKIVSAGEFLSAAERYNLISDLDNWVFTTLVDWFEQHPEDMANTHTASVNLSAKSITDSYFIQNIRKQLLRVPGLAQKICFEITETAAIANLNRARRFIVEMRTMGCRFALDDFGKGMSSLAYLKSLPVDYLKIDGEFVKDMLVDPIDYAMVEYINQIAHLTGMKTIAEYAETDEIIEHLRKMRIDFVQGYAIGKPEVFSRGATETANG